MKDYEKFAQSIKQIRKLMVVIVFCFVAIAGILIFVMVDSSLSTFKSKETSQDYVTVPEVDEEDFDKIKNGIHLRTGLIAAEGLTEVVNNCTNCHSAKLVTQNRMNKERWVATIRWMQETQNLWNLGKNEDIIVDYLVTNYPPKKKKEDEKYCPIFNGMCSKISRLVIDYKNMRK